MEKTGFGPAAGPGYAVFCRVAKDDWRRVVKQGKEGVRVLPDTLSFKEVWNHDLAAAAPSSTAAAESFHWPELLCPLPDPHVDTWGYAMTYPSHQEEVSLEDSFHFRKFGAAVSANSPISHRPHLDYEAEIGILMQRENGFRFGYVMTNDLTDRGVQVRTYDADNMGPGFSKAKSFEGALRTGSLLLIGGAEVWEMLEVELRVNGEKRQHLIASECLLRPGQIHNQLFSDDEAGEWALAATGTTAGVQFSPPSIWQKIGLMMASGFSREKAVERWLAQLTFLQPGDRLDFFSALLGRSSATVLDN